MPKQRRFWSSKRMTSTYAMQKPKEADSQRSAHRRQEKVGVDLAQNVFDGHTGTNHVGRVAARAKSGWWMRAGRAWEATPN